MRNYHVYIHYDEDSRNSNNKTAKADNTDTNNQTELPNPTDNGSTVKTVVGIVRSPLSFIAKSVPIVASVIAGATLVDKVVSAVVPIAVGYSGNYDLQINYSNFKATLNAGLNPLNVLSNQITRSVESYQNEQKISQERLLTGNSIINNYGGKGS